jgi:hypothetical protein
LTCTEIRKAGAQALPQNLADTVARNGRNSTNPIYSSTEHMLLLSRSSLARRQPRTTSCWDQPPYFHRIVGRLRALPGPRANFVMCHCSSSTHSRDHGAASSSALSSCVELGPCGPPQHGCFAPSAPLMTPCAGAVDILRTAWRMHCYCGNTSLA